MTNFDQKPGLIKSDQIQKREFSPFFWDFPPKKDLITPFSESYLQKEYFGVFNPKMPQNDQNRLIPETLHVFGRKWAILDLSSAKNM